MLGIFRTIRLSFRVRKSSSGWQGIGNRHLSRVWSHARSARPVEGMGRAHHRGCGGAEGPSGDANQRNGARYFRVDQRSLQQIGQRDRTFGHEGKPDACHHHGLHPVFTFGSKPRIEIDFPVAANPHHDLSHFARKAINVIFIRQIAEFDGIQTGQPVFWWKDCARIIRKGTICWL